MKDIREPTTFWGHVYQLFFDERAQTLLQRKKEELSQNANFNKTIIQVLPEGKVEVLQYCYGLEWVPWPNFFVFRKLIKTLTMEEFYEHIATEIKDQSVDDLSLLLTKEYRDNFEAKGEEAVKNFFYGTIEKVKTTFARKFTINSADPDWKSSETVIEDLFIGAMRSFKKTLAEESEPKFRMLFKSLSENLLKDIEQELDRNETFIVKTSSSDTLLPQNARVYSKRGNVEVLVVEQMPMTRTIAYSPSKSKNDQHNLNVAFPFVVFVLKFVGKKLEQMNIFYRNKMLTSIEDNIYIPNMMNIWANSSQGIKEMCKVCLGNSSLPQSSNLSEKTNEAISSFWSSRFNNDLNEWFDYYAARHQELSSLGQWVSSSRNNPRFPLAINWQRAGSLQDLINALSGSGSDEVTIRTQISKHIKDEIVSKVKAHQSQIIPLLLRLYAEMSIDDKEIKAKASNIFNDYQSRVKQSASDIMFQISDSLIGKNKVRMDKDKLPAILLDTFKEIADKDSDKLVNSLLFKPDIQNEKFINNIINNKET